MEGRSRTGSRPLADRRRRPPGRPPHWHGDSPPTPGSTRAGPPGWRWRSTTDPLRRPDRLHLRPARLPPERTRLVRRTSGCSPSSSLRAPYMAICIGLVWALRRRAATAGQPGRGACRARLLIVSYVEANIVIAVARLRSGCSKRERSPAARSTPSSSVGATVASIAGLGKLSTGPLVVVFFLVALVGSRRAHGGRPPLLAIVGRRGPAALAGDRAEPRLDARVPQAHDRDLQRLQRSDAAEGPTVAPGSCWRRSLAAAAIHRSSWWSSPGSAPTATSRARWAAMVVIAALAAFAIYKEGVVRTDLWHATILLFAKPLCSC